MKLSTIIVNWNSADYTVACVERLCSLPQPPAHEIVVVDNASYDGVGERLAARKLPVTFVQGEQNLGFGQANNAGFERCTGDIVLFLNPDTLVHGDALVTMAGYLQSHPGVGAVGCRLLNADGSVQRTSIQRYPTLLNQLLDSNLLQRLFPRLWLWGHSPLFGPCGQGVPVESVSGAALMVTREAFLAVEKFSSRYFMYAEDVDLCWKMWRAGFQVHHVSGATVTHYGGGTSENLSGGHFGAVMIRESTWLYLRRARGGVYAAAYRFEMALIAVLRLSLIVAVWPLLTLMRGRGAAGHALAKWRRVLGWSCGRSSVVVQSTAGAADA
ncbi:MAG: glycosyltransferase [Chitinivibrionales bacterium]|nr:glycosyltransferase [Chitinivibrionales bacterium]